MQKGVRINEAQLLYLASKAKKDPALSGYMQKKSSDGAARWQTRYFVLYQNLLFYYDNETTQRPSGIALLEGSYCDRIVLPSTLSTTTSSSASAKNRDNDKPFCFMLYYKQEGLRQYEFRAETEAQCTAWIDALRVASFSKVVEQKEQLEQKHLHLLHILDSERQAKWHYVQQMEELSVEVKKLKDELRRHSRERQLSSEKVEAETEEMKKIKKVQSFFRGWLCRRRWKQIVDEYIRSEHAESMRKRNGTVFALVESEEEYVKQLTVLVQVFLRPLRMAASSKKPPITHEDVNCIFLNSETLLFLHQIFYKGLLARMENWPTLVLGDLFDMLLPMLGIYQEYVRNHHYSLQVLAEYKQKVEFNQLLRRYEEKTVCEGHSLENYLTYPMHQVPRYIITIHELLAHTPHDHVERKSLEYIKSKLEELSQVIQDEVSETENIRKNLAIERLIVEGCDILLDVNQTFVRQGTLLESITERTRVGRGRLGSFNASYKEVRKEVVRQVYLFTNHLLLTTRASNGRLHLVKGHGKIALGDCVLIEDSSATNYSRVAPFDDGVLSQDGSGLTAANLGSQVSVHQPSPSLQASATEPAPPPDYNGLDLRLVCDVKTGGPLVTITLIAATLHEKTAWCSDIQQSIDNVRYSEMLNANSAQLSDASSVSMPHSVRCDPKLFHDDVDIKFSRTLNSCKVPQIRHASVDKLLERLTDLRFLSVDFLNTFLITYRVFSTGQQVLEALRRVYLNPELDSSDSDFLPLGSHDTGQRHSFDHELLVSSRSPPEATPHPDFTSSLPSDARSLVKPQAEKLRRISTGCMRGDVIAPGDASHQLSTSLGSGSCGAGFSKYDRQMSDGGVAPTHPIQRSAHSRRALSPSPRVLRLAPLASSETMSELLTEEMNATSSDSSELSNEESDDSFSPNVTSSLSQHGHNHRVIDTNFARTSSCYTDDFKAIRLGPEPSESVTESRGLLTVPGAMTSLASSSDTLISGQTLSTATSSDTLVPLSPRFSPAHSPIPSPKLAPRSNPAAIVLRQGKKVVAVPPIHVTSPLPSTTQLDALALSPATSPKFRRPYSPLQCRTEANGSSSGSLEGPSFGCGVFVGSPLSRIPSGSIPTLSSPPHNQSPTDSPKQPRRAPSPISYSFSSPNILSSLNKARSGKRGSGESECVPPGPAPFSPRSSVATTSTDGGNSSARSARIGAVVTSSRASKRRSSSAAAAAAFAVATAASSSSKNQVPPTIHRTSYTGSNDSRRPSNNTTSGDSRRPSANPNCCKRESVIGSAATQRVLSVLRPWVCKHTQDFESDSELKRGVKELLEDMMCSSSVMPSEQKAAASILNVLMKEADQTQVQLDQLLTPPLGPSKDNFDTISALDIAEQLTYLDHQIFKAIRSDELLGQAWMKEDVKNERAPHVLLVSKRFNEVSRLVVSEIILRSATQDRVNCIEKWAAIADICRCLHNYNGVLQICAAFVNSSVYRLKKTWEKITKQTRQMIERLQTLVSSDGRFRNMREELRKCDPPCIPYLGMYLTDLSFIEEGTPNITDDGLVNFCKMRMISHVIREIQLYQQTSYRIEHHRRVTSYLLDTSRLLDDETTYRLSLELEPRQARVSLTTQGSYTRS